MVDEKFNFYSPTNFSLKDLDPMSQRSFEVMDNLDFFTKRHCENVGNLSARISDYMHENSQFTNHCYLAGYLHDIGKLFVPQEIVSKDGPLTPEEYEIMKKHTTLGYEYCMKDINLRPFAEGCWYHHEALNGTGYPRGLKKSDIPFSAQVIRVADEYDAIVTKRQYKTHVNISETLKELIRDAQPTKEIVALDALKQNEQVGKINPKPLRALFKAVIADILYEISCIMDYIQYLKEQENRLNVVEKYQRKMEKSNKQSTKDYYMEGIKMLLANGETLDNYQQVQNEYREATVMRAERIKKLYREIKIIKSLKV